MSLSKRVDALEKSHQAVTIFFADPCNPVSDKEILEKLNASKELHIIHWQSKADIQEAKRIKDHIMELAL